MATKRLKRPRDPIALAKLIGDIATGQIEDLATDEKPKASPVEAGRLGGMKGGTARARSLTPERLRQIAAKAARKRWAKK
jgi:hypothetical protein